MRNDKTCSSALVCVTIHHLWLRLHHPFVPQNSRQHHHFPCIASEKNLSISTFFSESLKVQIKHWRRAVSEISQKQLVVTINDDYEYKDDFYSIYLRSYWIRKDFLIYRVATDLSKNILVYDESKVKKPNPPNPSSVTETTLLSGVTKMYSDADSPASSLPFSKPAKLSRRYQTYK